MSVMSPLQRHLASSVCEGQIPGHEKLDTLTERHAVQLGSLYFATGRTRRTPNTNNRDAYLLITFG
jgi:hypothetical protein